jgi:hypothetical protein
MENEGKRTDVYLAIYKREFQMFGGWSVGCGLKRGDITYFIYSLFLPLEDFKTKNEVLHYIIRTVLNEIAETEGLIKFYSPLEHFNNHYQLHKAAKPYKKGRNVRFFKRWYLPSTTLALESDAVDRGYSITERLD